MARYRFNVTNSCGGALVMQFKDADSAPAVVQEFTERLGGLAAALAYAASHGKRQDLADYYEKTAVMYQGKIIYSVVPEQIS